MVAAYLLPFALLFDHGRSARRHRGAGDGCSSSGCARSRHCRLSREWRRRPRFWWSPVRYRVPRGADYSQVLSIIQAIFAPRERAAVFGLYGAVTGLAAVVGPLLGGWLVTADLWGTSWRSIFLLNLPVGVLLLAATVRWVPESRSRHPLRLDLPGVALSAAVCSSWSSRSFRVESSVAHLGDRMLAASVAGACDFAWSSNGSNGPAAHLSSPMSLFASVEFSSGGVVSRRPSMQSMWVLPGARALLPGASIHCVGGGLVLCSVLDRCHGRLRWAVPWRAKAGRAVILAGVS